MGSGQWGCPTPGPGHSLSPRDCQSGSTLACGPVLVALGRPPRLVPTPQPPALAPGLTCVCSARWLCPDLGWPGAGWGDPGRLGLPPWGSRYWLNVDQSAGRQVVAAGCMGSPFSHKALATGSTNTANWAGDAPALPAPPPPPQRCAALPSFLPCDPDLRPLILDRHSQQESFLASTWVLPALQHSVQTSPPPGNLPGPPQAQRPEGPHHPVAQSLCACPC